MDAIVLMQILEGLVTVTPKVLGFVQTAQAGGTVTQQEVDAALGEYGFDRAALLAAAAARSG